MLKRLIFILAILLLVLPVDAQTTKILGIKIPEPPLYDLIDGETFDANPGLGGFDLDPWSAVSSGSGMVVSADVTCPAGTGFSSECFKATDTSDNRTGWAIYPIAAASGPVYCRAYLDITDLTGLDTTEQVVVAALSHVSTSIDQTATPFKLYLRNNAGTYELRGACLGTAFGATTISANTIYLIEMFGNQTTDTCDFKIDGVQKGPQTNGSFTNNIGYILFGQASAGAWQPDVVVDHVACDTGGWIGGI